MERNAIQWLGAPCCLRGSFAFYKSFSCRREAEPVAERAEPVVEWAEPVAERAGPVAERAEPVWRLGEFYFVRCGPQEPVCIAELALLWEDRTQRHQLASARLYFLPEDTPKGRTEEHGEDEVLAVSKKIVIRVEDLVNWTCLEPSGWKRSGQKLKAAHSCNGAVTSDPAEQKAERVLPGERRRVKVLSYLQYCRFRSLQRRMQAPAGAPEPHAPPSLQDPHLLALGGIRMAHHNTLVLYCRDTFHHPTLDSNASIWTQLGCTSLSLKGRPRKRRGRDGKGMERPPLSQSESWIERMKENVMGSVELPWEGGWLPPPEEQPFLDQLYAFMERRGSPISKVPNLGFKKIDLFLLFSVVKRLGGYERVTSERLWKQVYNELGGSPGSTSAATCTRRHYEKLMLAYEQHLMGGGAELSRPQLSVAASRSKELQKGKGAETNQKASSTNSPNGPASLGVPARKRGRPPSRRKAMAKMARTEAAPPPTTPTAPACPDGSVFQELNLSNLATGHAPMALLKNGRALEDPRLSQCLPPSPMLAPLPKTEAGLKVERAEPLSPAALSALTRLHMSGPLGAFSLPKGLCPLDLFRSRLGLGGVEGPDSPALQHAPVLLLQPKSAGDRQSPLAGGRGDDRAARGPSEPGDGVGREGRPRTALPPLRILPLDIDCSLQVRQLMRTRLGSAQLDCFARKLTQVLAQDLSRPHPPPAPSLPANQEQALPLNLSKRCPAKRPADEADDTSDGPHGGGLPLAAKRGKVEWEESAPPSALLGPGAYGPLLLEEQEEPADLSCPRRARASIREHGALGAEPQRTAASANGSDGGGAWDSRFATGADFSGAE